MRQAKRGSALLSALFIMTLVAIAATAMSTRLQLDIYRTSLTLTSDKLYLASQAVTFWAMDALAMKEPVFKLSDEEGKIADFPSHFQNLYPDVTTRGALYDMQAHFNLNNLQNKKFHLVFFKLLETTHTKMNKAQRKALLESIFHWLSPYQPGRGQEYLNYYLAQKPPYLPGYQLMQSVSELRLIQGVDADLYGKLLPYLTVLPEVTPINLNTAPKSILMSLGNGLTEAGVNEIMQAREEEGIKDMEKIIELSQKLDLPRDQITIESTYYLSIATTESGDHSLKNFTVIKRNQDKQGNTSVGIVSESLNTV